MVASFTVAEGTMTNTVRSHFNKHVWKWPLNRLAFAMLFLSALLVGGCSERRVALIIGEGGYSFHDPLGSPPKDADTIEEKLKMAGFLPENIKKYIDLDAATMAKRVEEFGRMTQGASVAVFYYSGHGMQIPILSEDGQQSNAKDFLIPKDSPKITDKPKVTLPPQLISITGIINQMDVAATKLIFIDACRSIPELSTQGLAQIEPLAKNTLIAYGAQAGGTTKDGTPSGNSPFTAALATHILDENIDVHQMLNRVFSESQNIYDNKSRPASYSTLTHDFFLAHRHIPN